jgi:hypothetical protein
MKNRTKQYTIHKGGNSNLFEKIRCSSIKRTLKRFNKLSVMCNDEINEFIADYIMNQQNTKSRVTSINKILTMYQSKLRISTNIDDDMEKCIEFIEQISKNDGQLNQFIGMLENKNFKLYKFKEIYEEEDEDEEENENEDNLFPLPTDIYPLSLYGDYDNFNE